MKAALEGTVCGGETEIRTYYDELHRVFEHPQVEVDELRDLGHTVFAVGLARREAGLAACSSTTHGPSSLDSRAAEWYRSGTSARPEALKAVGFGGVGDVAADGDGGLIPAAASLRLPAGDVRANTRERRSSWRSWW